MRGGAVGFPFSLPGFGARGFTPAFDPRFIPRFDSGGFPLTFGPSGQTCPDGSRGQVMCYGPSDCGMRSDYTCVGSMAGRPGVCCYQSFRRPESQICPDGSPAYRECFDDRACGSGFCFQQYSPRGVCCRDVMDTGSMEFYENAGTSGGVGEDSSFGGTDFRYSFGGMEERSDMGSGVGIRSSGGGLMTEMSISSSSGDTTSSASSHDESGEGACPEVTTRTCGDGPPPGRECFAEDAVCPTGQVCCPDPCGYICKNRR